MTKAKYDWDAIAKDYQDGIATKDICEKYKINKGYLRCEMYRKKIKRDPKKYVRLFTDKDAEKIRNKYYLGVWSKKKQTEIAIILNIKPNTLNMIINYKRFTNHLNLTPEQIHALHQEMKQKRKKIQF